MVKHSPHRRWKGHCLMCADQGWGGSGHVRGSGAAARTPWRVLRKIGKKRRMRRGDLGDQE